MKKLLLVALAVAGLATACRKEDEVVCPAAAPNSLATLTKRYVPPVQVFEFNPAQVQTFVTTGGAKLIVYANAFVRNDGTAPTGPVKLLFQEIYSPADMLLADMPTQSIWGEPLESGGEFNIRVLEGTQRLRLRMGRPGFRLISPQPARTVLDPGITMQLWSWNTTRVDTTGWQVAFVPRDSLSGQGIPVPIRADSSSSTTQYYVNAFWPDTLGWLNYDVYPPAPTRVTVQVATEPAADQRVYLIPADRNGAFRPYWNARTNHYEYSLLPNGLDLTAVVLQAKDGKYYFGTQRAPAAANFTYRPVLEEVTEEELVRRIRQL